jgi:acetyl esterase/lipase
MPGSAQRAIVRLAAGLAVLASAGIGAVAANAEPLPIASIARYEAMTGVALSPDGKHIAALVSTPEYPWPVVAIYDALDLTKAPVWIPSATLRIVNVSFFGNDRISFVVEAPMHNDGGLPTFTRKLYFSDLAGKKIVEASRPTGARAKAARDNQERYGGIGMRIFSGDLYDPDLVLIEGTGDTQTISELNLKTHESRLVAEAGERSQFLPGGVDLATGEPMIKMQLEIAAGRFFARTYIRDRKTRAWVRHDPLGFEFKDRRILTPVGFDNDPNILFVLSNRSRDFAAVYSYDIAAQKFSDEPLYAVDDFDVTAVGFRRDRANKTIEISGLTVGGPSPVQVIFDSVWTAAQKKIQAAFPGRNVTLQINKADRTVAVVTVQAPDFPPEYYLYKDGALRLLGKQRPWIDPATLGKAEFVTYTARDGMKIPAFVTYPPGWTPAQGPVPLIVLPHGGPWSRDELDWDGSGWPQFLATRGAAVIQPQYRGSDGWGLKLWTAGDQQWGLKMQDDNDDAAAYLVARGVADPKLMAIFGYSYGGFAAIAASVRPNSPYRCAIAGAGVASLNRIGNLWGSNPIARDVQGWTVAGMDPIKNVDHASIPIMLYHGDHDRQADTEHSRMFFKAMKGAGKRVEYHEIAGMWHTMPWHTDWQEQTLSLIETYLKSGDCGVLK